jgi:hypothetical protein
VLDEGPRPLVVRDERGQIVSLDDESRLVVGECNVQIALRPLRRLFVGNAKPDGAGGPMRSYLRATARLYLSLRDVSSAEYEAVMNRLAKSALTFSMAPVSRNYLATLRDTFA